MRGRCRHRSSGRLVELAALGVRPIAFDMQRGSFNPLKLASVRRTSARRRRPEPPDAVHAISLQPMLLASSCHARRAPQAACLVLHVHRAWLYRCFTHAEGLARPGSDLRHDLRSWHPPGPRRGHLGGGSHDIIFTLARGVGKSQPHDHCSGAGVVTREEFPRCRRRLTPSLAPPTSDGSSARRLNDVLVAAHQKLRERGIELDLALLLGAIDAHNPDAVTRETLAEWQQHPGLQLPRTCERRAERIGATRTSRSVPTLGGEGIPRALL